MKGKRWNEKKLKGQLQRRIVLEGGKGGEGEANENTSMEEREGKVWEGMRRKVNEELSSEEDELKG